MAATSLPDELSCDISQIYGILEPQAEEILIQIGVRPNQEIENDLVESLDRPVLKETREKIFNLAKDKVARCLCLPDGGGIFGDAFTIDPHESIQTAQSFVSQWEPTNRRVDHKFASDTIAFLEFVIGENHLFPEKLVKCATLEKGCLFEEKAPANEDNDKSLREELSQVAGPIDVQVVATTPTTETHLITVSPPLGEAGHTAGRQSEEVSSSDIPVDSTKVQAVSHSADKAPSTSNDSCSKTTCPEKTTEAPSTKKVDRDKASASRPKFGQSSSVDKSTSTEDLYFCIYMAGRNGNNAGGDFPIYRTEFEASVDYIERLHTETNAKVKKIETWQAAIDNRMIRIEAGDRIKALEEWKDSMSKQVTRIESDKRGGERKARAGNAAMPQPMAEMDDQPGVSNEPPIDGVSQKAPIAIEDESTVESHSNEREFDVSPPTKRGKRTRRRSSKKQRDARRRSATRDRSRGQFAELYQKATRKKSVEIDENPYSVLDEGPMDTPDSVFLRDKPGPAVTGGSRKLRSRNQKRQTMPAAKGAQGGGKQSFPTRHDVAAQAEKRVEPPSGAARSTSANRPPQRPSRNVNKNTGKEDRGNEYPPKPSTSRPQPSGSKQPDQRAPTYQQRAEQGREEDKRGESGSVGRQEVSESSDITTSAEGERSGSSNSDSYARVVTRNGWKIGKNQNDNRNQNRAVKKPIPKLRCAVELPCKN